MNKEKLVEFIRSENNRRENNIRWLWQCDKCGDKQTSYSHERHTMDICKCKLSGVDLEDDYARGMGEYTLLSANKFIGNNWVVV